MFMSISILESLCIVNAPNLPLCAAFIFVGLCFFNGNVQNSNTTLISCRIGGIYHLSLVFSWSKK